MEFVKKLITFIKQAGIELVPNSASMVRIQSVFKKKNMPQFLLKHPRRPKGGINSFVWSTKPFLYNIRKPRYKQNNMWYQISRIQNNEQSAILKSDTAGMYV